MKKQGLSGGKRWLVGLLALALLLSACAATGLYTPDTETMAPPSADTPVPSTYKPLEQYYDSDGQLTEEALELPTDVLVDVILIYEDLVELTLSSISWDDAYNDCREKFNGFRELETRADAALVMKSKQEAYAESENKEERINAEYLRQLLWVSIYRNQLSENG